MPITDRADPAPGAPPRPRRPIILAALGLGGAATVLLVAHTLVLKKDTDLSDMRTPRRYWEDVCVAVKDFLDYKYTPDPGAANSGNFEQAFDYCRYLVTGAAARQEVRPWQFWRTIRLRPFIVAREHLIGARPFEDPGRAVAVAMGYRLLDGISPFLPMWIAVLVLLPVLWWPAWEFAQARMAVAGAVFLLLVSGSAFLVDCLTLVHSAVGFYMTAIVALSALAVYAAFSERVTPRGLLARALVAGGVLGVSSLCRTASLALAPGFVLALLLAWRRLEDGPRRRRALLLAAALMLLAAPAAALRQPQQHDVWIAIWEGLGDFDRTKGHYWTDEEAKNALSAAGLPLGKERFAWRTDEAEAFFKRGVLADIRSDPAWYARILLRRLWATVTEEKVRAWGTRDWRWIRDQLAPNEGGMGKYYSWTVPVNSIGFARARASLPIPVLILPTLALLALAIPGLARGRVARLKPAATRSVAALASVAAGAIVLPVAITTASMPETQAFAFVYYLGLALLVQAAVRELRSPPSAA